MRLSCIFCFFLYLIHSSNQYSIDRTNDAEMVSDAWFDDIMTDNWNGVPKGCRGKPADVYFVLDTASNTPSEVINEQKQFFKELTNLFSMDGKGTRIGIISYGQTPVMSTPLGLYTRSESLQEAIQKTLSVGGERNMAMALNFIRRKAFAPEVSRRQVAHVVIMMTHGYSSDRGQGQGTKEAELLRKHGVYVYAVSTRTSANPPHSQENRLSDIASLPANRFVYDTNDYNIVDSLIEVLRISDCNDEDMPKLPPLLEKDPVCTSRRPTEIVFAVEHLGLGSPNAKRIISFIQAMLSELDLNSDITASIMASKDPISLLNNQVETIENLEKRLEGVVFPDVGQLLTRARRSLMRAGSGTEFSAHVQKVLVLFMDESLRLSKRALTSASSNRRSKIDTYVVYIGNGENDSSPLNMADIRLVANGADHIILVPSYQDLSTQSVAVDSLRAVCRGL